MIFQIIWSEERRKKIIGYEAKNLELVSKELNNLAAILHVYAGGLIFVN